MENIIENAIPTVIEKEKIIEREVYVDKIVTEIVEVEKEVIRDVSSLGFTEAIAKSMCAFNSEMENIVKNKNNPFFKSTYLDLGAIVSTIRPILAKHGLSIIQYPVNDAEGRVAVNTILLHENGDKVEFKGVFIKPEKMGNIQSLASTISYLRRYSVLGICNIAADDDDGNLAAGNVEKQTTQQPIPTQPTTTITSAPQVAPSGRIGRI